MTSSIFVVFLFCDVGFLAGQELLYIIVVMLYIICFQYLFLSPHVHTCALCDTSIYLFIDSILSMKSIVLNDHLYFTCNEYRALLKNTVLK